MTNLFPRVDQMADISWLIDQTDGLYFADVGSGKTMVALSAIRGKRLRGQIARTIVFAPLRVCEATWQDEGQKWPHLRDLLIGNASGHRPKIREQIIREAAFDIVMLNYENMPWLTKTFPKGVPGVDCVWMDEIDKMSSPTSIRFKGQGNIRKPDCTPGWKRWRHNVSRIFGQTGTPTRNSMLDLYAQVYCIDGGETFGQSFYDWRDLHFNEFKHENWSSWTLKKGHFEILMEAIKPLCRRGVAVNQYPVVYPPPRRVKMPVEAMKQYRSMADKFVMSMAGIRGGWKIKTNTPGDNYGKLRQISAGFIYDHGEGVNLHDAKYKELDSLISELQGAQLIIVYHFNHTLDTLKKRYGKRGFMEARAPGAIEKWDAGELQLLGIHPQSEGSGLNLHLSGCHNMALLHEPETAGLWNQVVGRLARTGQKRPVYVHRIHCIGTVDAVRARKVRGKIKLLEKVLEFVERNREAA